MKYVWLLISVIPLDNIEGGLVGEVSVARGNSGDLCVAGGDITETGLVGEDRSLSMKTESKERWLTEKQMVTVSQTNVVTIKKFKMLQTGVWKCEMTK